MTGKLDTVVCLAGARSLLRPEKKRYSRLSGRCAIVITTRKKKVLVVCLAGARSKNNDPCQDMKPGPQGKLMYYYFYHRSDLRKIIRFLRKIECIKFECIKFVLVLFKIDLLHFEHPIIISSI